MKVTKILALSCLVCLVLASSIAAQGELKRIEPNNKIIRVCSSNLPSEVNTGVFVSTGIVKLSDGTECIPPRVLPGPAPEPYPQAVIWEPGIEQLGADYLACDGLWFVNGNVMHANKTALVVWKIRIPNASMRLASEFERDLTLSLWVDSNEDKAWGKNELVFAEDINLSSYFPCEYSYVEFWYLTMFHLPPTTTVVDIEMPGNGAEKYVTKLWVRGALTYDDPDASSIGETLFGEYEDYRVDYFEIRLPDKMQKDRKS